MDLSTFIDLLLVCAHGVAQLPIFFETVGLLVCAQLPTAWPIGLAFKNVNC